MGAGLLEKDVLSGHNVELLPGAECGHFDALEHWLIDELLLFSCNLLLLQLLVSHVLLPVRAAEVGGGHIVLDSLDVQVDDLSTGLLIWAEIALACVRAEIDESSGLSGHLWLLLANGCASLRVDERANRVADSGFLLWEHRWGVLFEVDC